MIELIKSLLTIENVKSIVITLGILWGIWKYIKKYLPKSIKIVDKAAIITKELSEALFATSTALKAVDKAIKEDGSIEENSIVEAVQAGKTVRAEFGDVIAEFKKK